MKPDHKSKRVKLLARLHYQSEAPKVFGGEGLRSYNEQEYFDQRWIVFSEKIKNSRGECEACGSKMNLQVHHLEYRHGLRSWEHAEEDLAVLCEACHAKHHKIEIPKSAPVPISNDQADREKSERHENLLKNDPRGDYAHMSRDEFKNKRNKR